MAHNIIKPSPYTDGTYKRTSPRVVKTIIFALSHSETDAVHEGLRGCSCEAADLDTGLGSLGFKCKNVAHEFKAQSWSIYPIPQSLDTIPAVYVEFHNWPEMGLCNFETPIARKRYWWDVRPQPQWMTGDERGEVDSGGHFDPAA